jgi:stress-induced morphogen
MCKGTLAMADAQLKKKIYDVLKAGYFSDPDDAVDVSDGPEDSIHLVVFSRKFTGRSMKEKHDLIWSELMQKLGTDEWNKISLSIGASPEEIKAT